MNLTLELNAETEAKLNRQAALSGKRPEELVVEALVEKLAEVDTDAILPPESRLAELRKWLDAMPGGDPDASGATAGFAQQCGGTVEHPASGPSD